MRDINLYKRLIIQAKVDDCRKIINDSDPRRKSVLLTREQKAVFYELGINLKTFLSNQTEIGKNVSNIELANYFNTPTKTIQNVFYTVDKLGFYKSTLLSLLDKTEDIANENFGTLEEAEMKEKEVVC
ncbi:hypothetical protein [Staphylococcus haemolyticus]|uniref:hypothetical protein n=1 Tax=Staphylococcus haemolyticus TaxID=1283 RepID=UPI001F0A5122|nr:hypothetical protein [Staphylococcus haemolyticus]MCH4446765.1 hypothetical protein [Staphylococcus haemolyticus]